MKEIEGYEGLYSISDDGKVYSHSRNRFLKYQPDRNGYCYVQLSKKGKIRKLAIHRIVGMSFLSNPFNLPQINHIDGNKLNNHVSNLEWCTPRYNTLHAFAKGLKVVARGEDNHRAKLLWSDVSKIRKLYKSGNCTQGQIASLYGLHQTTILKIVNYKSWKT